MEPPRFPLVGSVCKESEKETSVNCVHSPHVLTMHDSSGNHAVDIGVTAIPYTLPLAANYKPHHCIP